MRTILRTAREVAEWRNALRKGTRVGLVDEECSLNGGVTGESCDVLVRLSSGTGVSPGAGPMAEPTVTIQVSWDETELWLEAGVDATRVLKVLSWTRPTTVYVSQASGRESVYKTMMRDFNIGGALVLV